MTGATPDDTPASGLLEYDSVNTWLDRTPTTGLRPGADRERRLALLQAYVDHVGVDPDTIVDSSRGDAATKNKYLKQLVQWASSLEGSDRAKHDAENTIRGFFMRNGFRVVARPYRDVYQRSSSATDAGGGGGVA